MHGDMLAPRASKRTLEPSFRSSRQSASNVSESARLLIMKIENLLDSSGIGLERIAITRNRLRHALQKLQRRLDILMPVHGNKAAGKQLRYGLAGGKPRQHVAVAMFQHANSFQSSTFRKGESRLAVPWSPV